MFSTDTFAYWAPSSISTADQVVSLKSVASGYNVTYTYTYDDNGNILSIGTNDGKSTTYTYDSANQLTRENNQAAGKTWVWTYDGAGNITCRKEFPYTTGSLESVQSIVNYSYGDSTWGDLLTYWNGKNPSYDTIGNLTSNGIWSYTWEHGRELASMSGGGTTWNFTYNADGLRTKRTNGSTTYSYVYNDSSLSQMAVGGNTLYFAYDASGTPLSINYDGTEYYYVLNLQGDVVAILDGSGSTVVAYTYDAWGDSLSTTGSLSNTLGFYNPLRYRGYVYDAETTHYYLQSRYYYPYLCRFLNADAFASTGQGLLGNNMFAYCLNNPSCYIDISGAYSYKVEKTAEGYNLIIEESYTDLVGKTTVVLVFEISFFDEYEIYLNGLKINLSSTGGEITTCSGHTLSFDYSSSSFEYDSFSVPFVEGDNYAHNIVFSEDGWGIESTASVDGLDFSMSITYLPNWFTILVEKINFSMNGLASGVPSQQSSAKSAQLSFGARIGCDMFSPTASMFR